MFKENFIRLCNERGEYPSAVCKKVGITPAAFSQWTEDTVPRKTTLVKVADYFGVSTDYLLGTEHEFLQTFAQEKDPPKISESEEKLLELFREVPEADRYMVIQMVEAALAAKRRERYMEEELGISYIRNPDPRYVARKDAGKKFAELEKVGKK